MNSTWPDALMVLKLFALLFSNQWVSQWKKQWARQQALLSPSQDQSVAARGKGKKKHKRHRSNPMSFYERSFTLRITLWYLLYQRLSADGTLADVIRNVRKGGADRLGKRGNEKLSKRIR